MLTSYEELVEGKQYIVHRPNDIKSFWKGTFRGEYQRYFEYVPNLIFVDCVQNIDPLYNYRMNVGPYKNRIDFRKTDIFHDIEKLKENKTNAIQNMEKRSLDKILKRLVNEHFEW